jgi:uncharacterized protein (TIGR03435 family)
MTRLGLLLFVGLATTLTLAAQQPAAPAFEVSSVKRNVSNAPGSGANVSPSGLLTIVNMPIRSLLRNVLELQDAQLIGGPDWMATERYDITAKTGDNAPRPEVPKMIETLLRDRFSLKCHRETRVLAVYALVRGTRGPLGPNLKTTVVDCAARAGATRAGRGGSARECGFDRSPVSLRATGMDLASVAAMLSQIAGRIVVDKTELPGQYDFELKWADSSTVSADPSADGGSIFTAVQEQLGLRLQADKAPIQVVVIDSVERPTPD